jgi:hypothetical protein
MSALKGKRGNGSTPAVDEAGSAAAAALPVVVSFEQAAGEGAFAADGLISALSEEEAHVHTGEAPASSQRAGAAQAARRAARRGQLAAAADSQAEQVRRLVAEQRLLSLQQELVQSQQLAAAATASAAAAAAAAAEAAKEPKGKKTKKHSKRRRSNSSSQSSSDSSTSQSSGSSDDSDSEHDADDNEQFKQHRHSGRSKDIKRHVRRRFSKAFSHDWKGAGLEAEARRLLTLQEAVRGLGKAGMTGKATAVAAAKLISDVQSGLKAYDASAQDAPDKVAALEKAVVKAVEKRANKKLAEAVKEEELLLVPSVGKRAGARAYGDKGRKGRGVAEMQDTAAAFTAGLAQGQQQQQQQQPQTQPAIPTHSSPMAMQQPYMSQQQAPFSQQYHPGMAAQQTMAAAQQYGGYGTGGGRYNQDRASGVCYNCNKPGHIGRYCPARGAAATAPAGTDGVAPVRDTQAEHTVASYMRRHIGHGNALQPPQIGPAVRTHKVPHIGHDMYTSHPQIGQGFPHIGMTHAQIADGQLRVCSAHVHVHVSRQEPSSAIFPSDHGCECGELDRASMCAAGRHVTVVDTLPKEAKVLDGPAQQAQARRMEQEHAQLHAELLREIACMQSSEFNIVDPDEYVLRWDKDDTSGACATERQRDQAEPPAARVPLRVAIKFTGVPPRGDRGACLFCKRKGHRRATCMAAPAVMQMPKDDNRTPLQREKERWCWRCLRDPHGG